MGASPGSFDGSPRSEAQRSATPAPPFALARPSAATCPAAPEVRRTWPTRAERMHLAMWFAFPALAVANGVARDATYGRRLSRDRAHSISVVPLCVAILFCARVAARRWPLAGPRAAVRVGLWWLALTLVFEFSLGSLQGVPIRTMLAEYDILRGRLWALVPVITAAGPLIAYDRDA